MTIMTSKDLEKDSGLMKKTKDFWSLGSFPLSPIRTDMEPKSASLKGIKIVLFDIYGTLIISQSGDVGTAKDASKAEVFLKMMEEAALVPRNLETAGRIEEAFFASIRKSHEVMKEDKIKYPEVDIISIWEETYREIMPILESPPEPDLELFTRLSLLYESLANRTDRMPGLLPLLEKCAATGRSTGIISNAQFYTPLLLERLTGKSLKEMGFAPDLMVWSYQEGRGKPSPELFEKALKACFEHSGVSADEILYVGNDMRNDIFPASRAGMLTALFAGDRRSLRLREKDPLYSYIKPDIILTELQQLTNLL